MRKPFIQGRIKSQIRRFEFRSFDCRTIIQNRLFGDKNRLVHQFIYGSLRDADLLFAVVVFSFDDNTSSVLT